MFCFYDNFISLSFFYKIRRTETEKSRSVLHMIQILDRVQELSSVRQMRSRLSDAHPP